MFGAKKGMIGIMQHADGSLLKPVCPDANEQLEDDEIRFYERISKAEDTEDKELTQLAPRFYGTQMVKVGDREVLCMKVENFTRGFRRACVLDIKVGRVTSIPTAPEAKRAHEASKYLGTRLSVGFSVPGMTVYDVTADSVIQHGKEFGKHLTGDTVADAFRVFLNAQCGAAVRPLCDTLLSQLQKIQDWFSSQRKYRFFASSILFTYDAASLSEQAHNADKTSAQTQVVDETAPDASNASTHASDAGATSSTRACHRESGHANDAGTTSQLHATARMIDFAHVWSASGEPDENYIEGLRHVIRLITQVRDELPAV